MAQIEQKKRQKEEAAPPPEATVTGPQAVSPPIQGELPL